MNRAVFLLLSLCLLASPRALFALGRQAERAPTLRETLTAYGIDRIARSGDSVLASGEKASLAFKVGSRKLLFNDLLVLMNGPLTRRNGTYSLAMSDIHFTLHPLLAPHTMRLVTPYPTIVLDPGHGGNDSGATADSAQEKALVLDIARRTAGHLNQRGIITKLTRTNDHYVSLVNRPRRAAALRADLFVSIHLNASANHGANGIETYVLPSAGFPSTSNSDAPMDYAPGNQHDAVNMALAHSVHRALVAHTGAVDRGIRRARFAVLRSAPCPAILVEGGFLSHAGERRRLATEGYRQSLAEGIAQGIQGLLRPAR